MDPIKDVKNIPGMTEAMGRWEGELNSVDKEADPNDPNSLSAFILKADGELETLINGYHHDQPTEELDVDQIPDMKKQAERGFYDAKEKLYQINQEYWGGNFDPQTVQDVLHDYAQGYYAYVNLCVGGSPATVVDRWNAVNEGDEVNCPQLVTSQGDFKQEASLIFVPRHMGGEYVPQKNSFFKKLLKWFKGLDYQPEATVQATYELAAPRSYSGVGGSVGFWVPFKKHPHWVLGTEVEGGIRLGIADPNLDPNLSRVELKTVEGVVFPVLLQGGYHDDNLTLLLQAGFWFTGAHIPESEQPYDPYSPKNPFLNPTGRAGLVAYVWKNRILLTAGYEGSPWGSGGYFEAGYHFVKKGGNP